MLVNSISSLFLMLGCPRNEARNWMRPTMNAMSIVVPYGMYCSSSAMMSATSVRASAAKLLVFLCDIPI